MTAVEVLEWIYKHETRLDEIFGFHYDNWKFNVWYLLNNFTPEEIVSKIEKYEVEKNHIAEADKKVEPEFKVGDWVKSKHSGMIFQVCTVMKSAVKCRYGLNDKITFYFEEIEHAEPPKEEKQKIEKMVYKFDDQDYIRVMGKINEIVDVVNELRGVI